MGAGSALAFKVLSSDVSPFQIMAVRSLIALAVLLPVSYYHTGYILGPRDNIVKLILRGICAGVDFACVGVAYTFLPLSEVSLLVNCHPGAA